MHPIQLSDYRDYSEAIRSEHNELNHQYNPDFFDTTKIKGDILWHNRLKSAINKAKLAPLDNSETTDNVSIAKKVKVH